MMEHFHNPHPRHMLKIIHPPLH